VAGGVFAQDGSWSIEVSGEIGTRINLDPDPNDDDAVALIHSEAYNGWDQIHGKIGLNYDRGPLNIGIYIEPHMGYTAFYGETSINADNYFFKLGADLASIFGGVRSGSFDGEIDGDDIEGDISPGHSGSINELWGNYRMLNDMLLLEVAYRSNSEREFWVSDKTALAAPFFTGDDADTFAFIADYSPLFNYVLAQMSISGLDFGVAVPNIFFNEDGVSWWDAGHQEFVEDTLKQAIFGARFEMSPIEFAAQFKLGDYGAYFGGRYFLGPVTIGLSFQGIMNDSNWGGIGNLFGELDEDWHIWNIPGATAGTSASLGAVARALKAGLDLDYNGGSFGAGIRGWFNNFNDIRPTTVTINSSFGLDVEEADALSDTSFTFIGVEPRFWINPIPSHMRFQLDAGFYFASGTANGDKQEMQVSWAVSPQILWNFKGNGAPDGYFFWAEGHDGWYHFTGIMVRYTMASDFGYWADEKATQSTLDFVFRWGL